MQSGRSVHEAYIPSAAGNTASTQVSNGVLWDYDFSTIGMDCMDGMDGPIKKGGCPQVELDSTRT
ncbi:hypothetical protein SAMN05444000_13618 [Shimia gijangensis]|uniref:Uncharacterized protein n=1 Tax=Shimia gijangensis TaxID=1470563 RepID=A0A1M6T855_9RHOB|nr:hypothetical protein SAMN05444000_13618 [Shimia gijangensis]